MNRDIEDLLEVTEEEDIATEIVLENCPGTMASGTVPAGNVSKLSRLGHFPRELRQTGKF
jgi:hypothetical protein